MSISINLPGNQDIYGTTATPFNANVIDTYGYLVSQLACVTDTNFYTPASDITDIVTITVSGNGGTLSDGSGGWYNTPYHGLVNTAPGVYELTGTAQNVTDELDALIFTPKAGTPNSFSSTILTVTGHSSADGSTATTAETISSWNDAVDSAITGTAGGQRTVGETPIAPFAHVTINDVNAPDGSDLYNLYTPETVTITLEGATGTFSGAGLTLVGSNVYQLTGTAQDVTNELDALIFRSNGGATTFVVSDTNEYGVTTTDSTTSMTDYLRGDTFVFQTLKGSPVNHPDIIRGFTEGRDVIDLHPLDNFVPGHHPLTFIGGDSFADFHAHHPTVWGMVRDAHGQVQINVDHHLADEMAINVPYQTLHAADFIL
jgi:hypothetical protein